jgi:hypothetical protein
VFPSRSELGTENSEVLCKTHVGSVIREKAEFYLFSNDSSLLGTLLRFDSVELESKVAIETAVFPSNSETKRERCKSWL